MRGRQVVVAHVGVEDLRVRRRHGRRRVVASLTPPMQETVQSGPAGGRPAARADRRAHAARRAGRELLVPAPSRGLRVGRRALRRPRRGRHGLRRGLRRRRARAARAARDGRGREPRGPRARAPQVHAPRRALRARPRRELRRALRRRRLPPDDRARGGSRRPCCATSARCCGRAGGLRLDAEPADARSARAPPSRTTPGISASTAPRSSARCARACSGASSCSGSSTPACCARTSWRCAPAGTACTRRSGSRRPFYDRFTPAISARDFALRPGPLERALDFVAVLRP